MQTPTYRDLIVSLQSEQCPACHRRKTARRTLCNECYYRLPSDLRNRLYSRLGNGYTEAVKAAFKRLGKDEFRLPAAPTPATRNEQMTMFGGGSREGMPK